MGDAGTVIRDLTNVIKVAKVGDELCCLLANFLKRVNSCQSKTCDTKRIHYTPPDGGESKINIIVIGGYTRERGYQYAAGREITTFYVINVNAEAG